MVSGPALPERPAIVPGGAQSFVAGACCLAVLFPRPAVLSDRYDWNGLPVDDGSVATARVIGAVRCPAGHRDAMSREGAVTVPISSPSGIWSISSGSTGLSPSLLGVNSTAQMSEVAVSMARCTLRHWRQPCAPCLRACHLLPGSGLPANHERAPSPSPKNLMPLLSTSKLRGPSARR
jgi:hypothetical protein